MNNFIISNFLNKAPRDVSMLQDISFTSPRITPSRNDSELLRNQKKEFSGKKSETILSNWMKEGLNV